MKVVVEKTPPVFEPITLCFETFEELDHFVTVSGKVSGFGSNPFYTYWSKLKSHRDAYLPK